MALPEELLASAPEPPWHLPPQLFVQRAERARDERPPRPSTARALEVLDGGELVLDVGAGAGAASLPLAPPAGFIVAVDEKDEMLDAFAGAAAAQQTAHEEIRGRWPDVAGDAPEADLVVCHHVVYNVADIVPFVEALTAHARRRVVVEMTRRHPMSGLSPLFRAIHGLERPTRPSADDLLAVLSEMGYVFRADAFSRPHVFAEGHREQSVAFARRRLCVGPERDEEIERYLRDSDGGVEELVTVSWEPPR